jgi:hypothetical protein
MTISLGRRLENVYLASYIEVIEAGIEAPLNLLEFLISAPIKRS